MYLLKYNIWIFTTFCYQTCLFKVKNIYPDIIWLRLTLLLNQQAVVLKMMNIYDQNLRYQQSLNQRFYSMDHGYLNNHSIILYDQNSPILESKAPEAMTLVLPLGLVPEELVCIFNFVMERWVWGNLERLPDTV